MPRLQILPLLALALVACTGDDSGVPRQTVLVADVGGAPFQASLSPDGTRLAWAQPVNGQSRIHVGAPDGSNPVRVSTGTWDFLPLWSPDGKAIAYSAESPAYDVWVVSLDGGEPRQLTSGPANDEAAGWLSDGSGIVFHRTGAGDTRTLVAPVDGGPIRPLMPQSGGNIWGAVSPDGLQVAYEVFRGRESTIWVQPLAGGPARQLTTEGFEDGTPSRQMWSPDSRHLVYSSRRTGTLDLWTVNVETGEQRQITSDVRNDAGHRWSPDGRWIAFSSDRGGQWDVWIVAATGGDAIRVTNDLAIEQSIDWFADGQSLFFNRNVFDAALAVTVPGGEPRTLVDWPGYVIVGQAQGLTRSALSPDGATILFVGNRSGNDDIWSVPVAGGEAAPFAASPLDDAQPQYSPDGREVAFVSNRTGSFDLFVVPAGGGDPRRLTDWPGDESRPAWSPDGRTIAFVSDRDASQQDVWLMSAAGGTPRRLTTMNRDIRGHLAWSPDGASIYVYSMGEGGAGLQRVPIAGGRPRALQVSPAVTGAPGALSPDGNWFAYAAIEGGWAFIEITPTGGGAPRRVTRERERVWHPWGIWSPDGSKIAVPAWQFGDDATTDILELSVNDSTTRLVTTHPRSYEGPDFFLPDGRLVFTATRNEANIVKVDVGRLLRARAEPGGR
jgi:Tol biopolymer transport system component